MIFEEMIEPCDTVELVDACGMNVGAGSTALVTEVISTSRGERLLTVAWKHFALNVTGISGWQMNGEYNISRFKKVQKKDDIIPTPEELELLRSIREGNATTRQAKEVTLNVYLYKSISPAIGDYYISLIDSPKKLAVQQVTFKYFD